MYLTKSVGSSVFFVFFPLFVVISCDEKGYGLLLVNKSRETWIEFQLFSWSMKIKDFVLDVLTLRIMRNRGVVEQGDNNTMKSGDVGSSKSQPEDTTEDTTNK